VTMHSVNNNYWFSHLQLQHLQCGICKHV